MRRRSSIEKKRRADAALKAATVGTTPPKGGLPFFLAPESGMGKKSGSRMNNQDQISKSLVTIFWVQILKFFDANPGSGMEKFWISDLGHSSRIRNTFLEMCRRNLFSSCHNNICDI
jgi:hypothetical protein